MLYLPTEIFLICHSKGKVRTTNLTKIAKITRIAKNSNFRKKIAAKRETIVIIVVVLSD